MHQISVVVPKGTGRKIVKHIEKTSTAKAFLLQSSTKGDLVLLLVKAVIVDKVMECLKSLFKKLDIEPLVTMHEVKLPVLEQKEEEKEVVPKEEIKAQLIKKVFITPEYVLASVLAGILAILGLLGNNVYVLFGSMLIAPFLKPLMATAFSVVTGELDEFKTGAFTVLASVFFIIIMSFIVALPMPFVDVTPELLARTQPSVLDIGIALASGVAGVLALTTGISEVFVGVAIAAAIIPAASATGIFSALLLRGQSTLNASVASFILLSINLIAIIFASIITFWVRRIRPEWWRVKRVKKDIKRGILVSLFLLVFFSMPVLDSLSEGMYESELKARIDQELNFVVSQHNGRVLREEFVFDGKVFVDLELVLPVGAGPLNSSHLSRRFSEVTGKEVEVRLLVFRAEAS